MSAGEALPGGRLKHIDKVTAREPVEKSRSPLNLSSFLLGTSQNV